MELYGTIRRAKNENEGLHSKSYAKFQAYIELVRVTNPRSLAKINDDRKTPYSTFTFKRLFISFKTMKTNIITKCRPFIILDKWRCSTNYCCFGNRLFLIILGIVKSENQDNWTLFV